MSKASVETFNIEQLRIVQAKPRVIGSRLGKIVQLPDPDTPIVDYPGNPLGPQRARMLGAMTRERLRAAYECNSQLLLMFEEDDPSRPLILDVVVDRPAAASASDAVALPRIEPPGSVLANEPSSAPAVAARLATIAAVEEDGVLVRFAGESAIVKVTTAIVLRDLKDPVVVLPVPDAPPVIVAQVYARVPIAADGGSGAEVVLKGTRVRIEADAELVLKAGECTLHFDARGKAVTTANQIVSRARDSNKVQGGSVQLN